MGCIMKEVVELYPIPDIYADDVASVEVIGSNVRLTYFTWQNGQRVVVCRLVRPMSSIKGTVREMLRTAGHPTTEQIPSLPLH